LLLLAVHHALRKMGLVFMLDHLAFLFFFLKTFISLNGTQTRRAADTKWFILLMRLVLKMAELSS